MKFYQDGLFHIYNQGNNRRIIFPRADNYYYFLWKMRSYLLPYGNLLAYCLMPNHYHWFFKVARMEIPQKELQQNVLKMEMQRLNGETDRTRRLRQRINTLKNNKPVSLNKAIGILQRTYARAINKQQNWSGNLFRQNCKAKDARENDLPQLCPPHKLAQASYAVQCIQYIHQNPVKAGLVSNPRDWPFSSATLYQHNQNFQILQDVAIPTQEEILQIGAIPISLTA